MFLNCRCLCLLVISVFLATAQDQGDKKIFDFCYNANLEGFRLNTTVLKTKCVFQLINCVIECAAEPCCRSINYRKTLDLHNESNCEMLHNVTYNTSEKLLEKNPSYDHAYLVNPLKEYNSSCFADNLEDNKIEAECSETLGMENGQIGDDKITASSKWNGATPASNARLNFQAHGEKSSSWSSRERDLNQWLQVDFQQPTEITGISTQGRNDCCNQFVRKYKILFSDDGIHFENYSPGGTVKEFQGNSDKDSVVHQKITPSIYTRFARINPTVWNEHISMRVEFYGCTH